jgi:hypothetical protein
VGRTPDYLWCHGLSRTRHSPASRLSGASNGRAKNGHSRIAKRSRGLTGASGCTPDYLWCHGLSPTRPSRASPFSPPSPAVPPEIVTLFFSGKFSRSSGEFRPNFDGIGQQIDGIVKNGSLLAGRVRSGCEPSLLVCHFRPSRAPFTSSPGSVPKFVA